MGGAVQLRERVGDPLPRDAVRRWRRRAGSDVQRANEPSRHRTHERTDLSIHRHRRKRRGQEPTVGNERSGHRGRSYGAQVGDGDVRQWRRDDFVEHTGVQQRPGDRRLRHHPLCRNGSADTHCRRRYDIHDRHRIGARGIYVQGRGEQRERDGSAVGRVERRAPPNRAPVAGADTYTTNEDSSLEVGAPGMLANDTDADNDPFRSSSSAYPAAVVDIRSDGSFTYEPYPRMPTATTSSPTGSVTGLRGALPCW